jgi:murein L,D-transpeptidase YcbB/YkuD
MKDGKPVWSTRIVVGQPGKHATPLLAETIKYITFNPTWNVPPSTIRNEYLPALARDPTALARIGLRIGRNSDGSIRIYQPPSDRNALGRVRFNFPNQFLVYQHDTPDKYLFGKAVRAYSHGCMRVENPDKYEARPPAATASAFLCQKWTSPCVSALSSRKGSGTSSRTRD